MRILLGNQTLSLLAGSETWILTLAKALKDLGHEVTAFSPDCGLIATKIGAFGVECVNDVKGSDNSAMQFSPVLTEGEDDFDVIICNHNQITKYLHERFPNTPIIATVHGILHKDPKSGEIWPEHRAGGHTHRR